MTDKKRQIERYYDQFADVYDVKHGVALAGHVHNFARHYEPFLRRAVPEGARVLELGCGSGVYTRWLCDRGCEVVAMDISGNMAARARSRCPEANIIVGDCEDPAAHLPAAEIEKRFDIVLGVNTFSYYLHKKEALQRYARLLRNDGKLVLIDMNGRCPLYRIMTWTGKNEMNEWYDQVAQSNGTSLQRLVRQAGLHLQTLDHFAFIPNGVGPAAVTVLRPVDAALTHVPGIRNLAMRLGLVAGVT